MGISQTLARALRGREAGKRPPLRQGVPFAGARARPARDIDIGGRVPVGLPLDSGVAAVTQHLHRVALHGMRRLFDDARCACSLNLARARSVVDMVRDCLDEDPEATISLVRLKARDDPVCMHSIAVCALMGALSTALGLGPGECRVAMLAGLLHDIGKALVPPHILSKAGVLTDGEFTIVRAHARHGHEILAHAGGVPAAVRDVALHHHERPDGAGYPDGLREPQIPVMTAMAAVCDVYEALTSNRSYKDAWDPAEAIDLLRQGVDTGQFNADVVSRLVGAIGVYPIGSLVRLKSERLAVVCSSAAEGARAPCVTVFHCLQTAGPVAPYVTLAQDVNEIRCRESNRRWRFKGLDRLWAGDIVHRLCPEQTSSTMPFCARA